LTDQTKAPGRQPRRGYQAADLRAAMTDPYEGVRQSPRIEVPRTVIEHMRVTGRDRLTSTDYAVYHGLVALAVEAGISQPSHTIALTDLAKYTDVRHADRIKASLKRLSETVVTYDIDDEEIEETGWLHLLTDTRLRRKKSNDRSTVTFVIPEMTRQMFHAPEEYAKLEVLAFPRFRCRYSSRLYPRLALRAGMKRKIQTEVLTWTVEPEALAKELGFPTETWRYNNFERDCLKPVMRDIADHVTRFEASFKVVRPTGRGSGRGNPVEKVIFSFSPARRLVAEAQMRHMTSDERARVTQPDEDVVKEELPSANSIAKACTHLGRGPDEISEAWRAAVLKAKAEPLARIAGRITGGGLQYAIQHHGVDVAFRSWADAQKPNVALDTRRPPSVARVTMPAAPAPVVAPVVQTEDAEPVRTPRTLEAKIEASKAAARDLMNFCDGIFIGPSGVTLPMPTDDETLAEHLYDDCSPWAELAGDEMPVAYRSAFAEVSTALPLMHRLTPGARRAATKTLAAAVAEWDSEAIVRAARAVSAQPDRPKGPPPVPSFMRSRGTGFVDSLKTESLVEGY
jgi:hypothetical protein